MKIEELKPNNFRSLTEAELMVINTKTEIKNIRRRVMHTNQMNDCRQKVSDLKHGIDSEMISGIFFNNVEDYGKM